MPIRECVEADIPAIVTVLNAGAAAFPESLGESFRMPPADAAGAKKMMKTAFIYGYYTGAKLEAAIALERRDDVAIIRGLYVLPERQRQGIGRRLATHIERLAEAARCRKALLTTFKDADRAQDFWGRRGFHVVGDDAAAQLIETYWPVIPEDRRPLCAVMDKRLS